MFVSIFSNLELNSSKLLYMNPVFYCDNNMEDKINEVDACNMLEFCDIGKDQIIKLTNPLSRRNSIYTAIRGKMIESSSNQEQELEICSESFSVQPSVIGRVANSA